MLRRARGTRRASWKDASRRVTEGRTRASCLLAAPGEVLTAAVAALRDVAESQCAPALFGAQRASALALVRSNYAPESVITACSAEPHREVYARAADAALKGITADVAWRAVLATYWRYLKASSGVEVRSDDERDAPTVMLLWSTFGKPLSKHPFKHKAQSAAYGATRAALAEATEAVERYAYYMRPLDPMVSSPQTSVRLHEMLAYAATLYRWLLWMMDTVDARVVRHLGRTPRVARGPRETMSPEALFGRHRAGGPAVASGSGEVLVLTSHTATVFDALEILGATWAETPWKSGVCGLTAAVVAAVDLVTFVHHHAQTLINLTLAGYVCWLDDGMEDPYLRAALRAQCRFHHLIGDLAPTSSSHAWGAMERGTLAWFNYAIARSLASYGGPTERFARVLATTGQRDMRFLSVAPAQPPLPPLPRASQTPSPPPRDRDAEPPHEYVDPFAEYLNWPVPVSPPPLPEGPPSSDDELEVDGGGRRPLRRSRDAATYVNRKDLAPPRAAAGEGDDEEEEEDDRFPRRDGDAGASTSSSQESAADEEFPPGIGVRDGEEDDEDEGVEEEDVYVDPDGDGERGAGGGHDDDAPWAPLTRHGSMRTSFRRGVRGSFRAAQRFVRRRLSRTSAEATPRAPVDSAAAPATPAVPAQGETDHVYQHPRPRTRADDGLYQHPRPVIDLTGHRASRRKSWRV
ncbi:tegument protein VP11/12 [Suid alphaherpesvirus 1]|uniref:Tegument protein UL46 homolog n=1 Tax=Suid herpesvirus 1 TaxID=10345 RepID=A0A0S2MLX5_SUHV|nr:tegument protein VP11/12 [Suid alphaherpesvirus 1]ALO75746.1 tegument protein VP11/12 [Suid alphaherpesvirus 1]